MKGRFTVRTFGCKLNTHDTRILEAELRARGWTATGESGEVPDLVVVNTCTVTAEADRQGRKLAARLAREHPEAVIVSTGCSAQVAPERTAGVRGVDLVVGNQDKPALVDLVLGALEARKEPSAAEPREHAATPSPTVKVLGSVLRAPAPRSRAQGESAWPPPETGFAAAPDATGRTRMFLKVQEGCDASCTFCIIPFARGPARSLAPPDAARQVRELCAAGTREVVLTGTNLGQYGDDLIGTQRRPPGEAFTDLVELLLTETPVERLRLSSLDPAEISPRLLALLETEPRLCPHLHISVQSLDDGVLRRMRRKHTGDDAESALRRIAEVSGRIEAARKLPGGIFVGMDVIAGFPGETEDGFRRSLARFEALPWQRLHVFPFSEREGTAAARLKGRVVRAERKRRCRALMDLSNRRLAAHCRRVCTSGLPLEVLVEGTAAGPGGEEGWASGTTSSYLRVLTAPEGTAPPPNSVISVLPERVHTNPRAGTAFIEARMLAKPGT